MLSHEFKRAVLRPAGLVANQEDGTTVSYHSFRHTFISLLKLTGGNQAVAKELVGHSSDLISDLYTHVPVDALQQAVDRLPSIEI